MLYVLYTYILFFQIKVNNTNLILFLNLQVTTFLYLNNTGYSCSYQLKHNRGYYNLLYSIILIINAIDKLLIINDTLHTLNMSYIHP